MADYKKPQAAKPRRKLDIWNRIAVVILSLFLVGCISVFFILVNVINDPEGMRFSQDGLSTLSNSRIFDASGNLIFEFGDEIREDVEYEQIPQSVVDAFLSIEDSRYFTHNGFDLPRFMAAALTNLRSGDFSQGGSTLTMQMIDNAFTKNQEDKIKGENNGNISRLDQVKLKIQEIYLALIAEQSISKEDIFEYYVDRIWFGSDNNTRGIQKASRYFFSKDVSELTLGEAAYLAGAINSPYYNNPVNNIYTDEFDFLEYATQRRNTTLALMLDHGYITQEEYELAVNTDLAFTLDIQETVTTDPNEAYIQQVITECRETSGQDPAIIPMDIYTALNQDLQIQTDGICNGTIDGDGTIAYANDGLNMAMGIINNENGEIMAVGPGRYYHDEIVKHDLSITVRQPGSTMKPLLAYAPAFDILGWSTVHTVNDKPADYFHAGFNLSNSDNRYNGYMSLQDALGVSKNTTAAATMVELINDLGYDYWIDYCKKLGYDADIADQFNEQYVIGGSEMRATPIQQASAFSNFGNQGVRVNAHRIRKIIRRSDKKEISGNTTEYEIVSEQAAFMISTLLEKVVTGGYQNLNNYLAGTGFPIYAKSGTTDWGTYGLGYGIPTGAMRDSWSVAYTSAFTVATWSGYTSDYEAQGYYITSGVLNQGAPFYTSKYLLQYCHQFADYESIPRPDGISDYRGGYIKTEYLSQGDTSSYSGYSTDRESACTAAGGTWDSENGICNTKKEETTNETACTGSGGSWDNGACSCPDGYELNGNACQESENSSDPKSQCENWGGSWNGTYCEFNSKPDDNKDDSNQDQNTDNEENNGDGGNNDATAFIPGWMDIRRYFA